MTILRLEKASEDALLVELLPEPEMAGELSEVFSMANDCGDVNVVIDFSKAGAITNDVNISRMLKLRKLLGDRGNILIICGIGEEIKTDFGDKDLDHVFMIVEDQDKALVALEKP